MLFSHYPNPISRGKYTIIIYTCTLYLGYWPPLAITKNMRGPFPGFLGKSSRDYVLPHTSLSRLWTRIRPPYAFKWGRRGGGGLKVTFGINSEWLLQEELCLNEHNLCIHMFRGFNRLLLFVCWWLLWCPHNVHHWSQRIQELLMIMNKIKFKIQGKPG